MDFVFQPQVQSIFNSFSELFGVRIAFFNPSGEERCVGAVCRDCCRFCMLLRSEHKFLQRCHRMDSRKRQQSLRTGEMISYKCHAGLTEAVCPVWRNDKLLGFAMIGQFRTGEGAPSFLEHLPEFHHKREELMREYENVPCIAEEKLEHLLTMFTSLVEYINQQGMIASRQDSLLENALQYMKDNLERPVSLEELSELLNKSPGTISNLFRNRLGKSFKQTLIELKISKVEDMLNHTPGLTVQEAALRVGYSDALYFSRLFKKYRGISPSDLKH